VVRACGGRGFDRGVQVRARATPVGSRARVVPDHGGAPSGIEVTVADGIRGLAPGQSAVAQYLRPLAQCEQPHADILEASRCPGG